MTKQLEEIHPGEILLEEFMTPMAISGRRLASDLDVPASRISELVHGTRPITADTAVRLGLFFKMDPRFWMNLQTEYDMHARRASWRKRARAAFASSALEGADFAH